MKYVVIQTADGEKLPIIFPERLVHSDVAKVMAQMISFRDAGNLGKQRPVVASAGFVGMENVTVSGESESLGSIRHNPLDALRIAAGASVAHMPDAIIQPLADKLNFAKDRTLYPDHEQPGTVEIDTSLLLAAINEIREWKVDKGGDDQVVLNLEAAIRNSAGC